MWRGQQPTENNSVSTTLYAFVCVENIIGLLLVNRHQDIHILIIDDLFEYRSDDARGTTLVWMNSHFIRESVLDLTRDCFCRLSGFFGTTAIPSAPSRRGDGVDTTSGTNTLG